MRLALGGLKRGPKTPARPWRISSAAAGVISVSATAESVASFLLSGHENETIPTPQDVWVGHSCPTLLTLVLSLPESFESCKFQNKHQNRHQRQRARGSAPV